MANTRALKARLRQGLLFLAIVWGVTFTFVAIELIWLHGMDLVSLHPEWFGRVALSSATQHSTACEAPAGSRTGTAPLRLPEARAGSWILGVRVGQDAQIRQVQTVDAATLAASEDRLRQLASLLATPAPTPFTPRNRLLANTEFVQFLESDADGTAHGLAAVYSPVACQIFKLGGFWGYTTLSRVALAGEPSIFAAEIAHYARQAGLPANLWQPMIARTRPDATPDQVNDESTKLTVSMTQYLSGTR